MVEWYHSVYDRARKIEGAAQRVQEDTIKFSRIMEGLNKSHRSNNGDCRISAHSVRSIDRYTNIFFGDWEYGLVVGALIWSIGGTLFLVALGLILRLVGVNTTSENAYRKILVIAEDDGSVRPKTIEELFLKSEEYIFKLYSVFMFNIGRIAYLQANVLSVYVFLAPAIVAGVVTLGVMQQIIRAFGRVEGSMQYILKAWPTIIELASEYKRLREFEKQIQLYEGQSKSLS